MAYSLKFFINMVHHKNQLKKAAGKEYPYPKDRFSGRGVVMVAGKEEYLTNAWVSVNMLRQFNQSLPIQLWYIGEEEINQEIINLLKPLNVRCIDARTTLKKHPLNHLGGWECHPYAIMNSSFEEVLFIDADNVCIKDPEYLFSTKEYEQTGAIFWPDYLKRRLTPRHLIWKICDVKYKNEPAFESGQIVINKRKCWKALNLTMHMNEYSHFFYQHMKTGLWGDKDTYHMSWNMLKQPYSMIPHPIKRLTIAPHYSLVLCQHDFEGDVLFQHRNLDKWQFKKNNLKIPGFQYEEECLAFIHELRNKWKGMIYS